MHESQESSTLFALLWLLELSKVRPEKKSIELKISLFVTLSLRSCKFISCYISRKHGKTYKLKR